MYTKYKIEKEQVSYDNGSSWRDVVPEATRLGESVGEYTTLEECEGETSYSKQYLTIESLEDNNEISFSFDIFYQGRASEDNPKPTIYYSRNGVDWTSCKIDNYVPTSRVIATLNTGEKVFLKGTNDSYHRVTDNLLQTFSFVSSKRIITYGNVMSMKFGDYFINEATAGDFSYLFYNSENLVSAENLIIETSIDITGQYEGMFSGCTSLTTPPALPSTTLTKECYKTMFMDCSSLATAPVLPATTLANDCYRSMFNGCSSLTTPPALPATTLSTRCYTGMFMGCTSLTTTPVLSASTMANLCYYTMFSGCTSLTVAPELPATTLATSCYERMFAYCTGLTSGNTIGTSAMTMAISACTQMFAGCTSLTTLPELPASTLATSCYEYMFLGCTGLVTAQSSLPATTLADKCYDSMFKNCTSLTGAPALPATSLTHNCYTHMFQDCTSLATAPELPAGAILGSYNSSSPDGGSYYYMFDGCTSLNYIKCLATSRGGSDRTGIRNGTIYWVRNVSPTGTFVKAASMNDWPSGEHGIPSGWIIQDA